MQTIGDNSFDKCTGLTEIQIPESVTSIGNQAFRYCSNLKKITSLAKSAPSIQSETFSSIASDGSLFIPQDATGYDDWMQTSQYYLGYYNWSCQTLAE